MADRVTVTVSHDQSAALLKQISKLEGILDVAVFSDISGRTHIISVTVLNKNRTTLISLLDRNRQHGLITQITTDVPQSVFLPQQEKQIADDTSEASWEEMENDILKESNATLNALGISFVAGFIAVIGLSTNALHLVIAAMVVIPGFEPFLRIGLGIAAGSKAWQRGLISALKIYALLIAGSVTASLILAAMGQSLIGAKASYLSSFALVDYWSTPAVPGILVSLAASAAGVLIVAGRRSILTAGVMIALALVPSAALVGIGIAERSTELIYKGALRWLIDASLIVVVSTLILLYKRLRLHRRSMWL